MIYKGYEIKPTTTQNGGQGVFKDGKLLWLCKDVAHAIRVIEGVGK